MKMCNRLRIHLIVDEIYALSVYDVPDPHAVPFKSILEFDTNQYIDERYLHHLYGMSKDTAAGGMRLGCLYTRNQELMKAVQGVSQFHWSGSASEKIGICMLEDEGWMDAFLDLSRKRLQERNLAARELLGKEGIGYLPGANAGFFLWIDLRKWCGKVDREEWSDPFAGEDELTKKLIAKKVFVTNGKFMSAEEPGWYRLIFSQDKRTVEEGIKRIVAVLKDTQSTA
ncbi:uncharacterized protein KY384_001689 [Bacidia gigantensis]|uniref:uncharacterized protein n=1 Tax=Bacidia gigantensis TaxID=2732470 RepID=UPI001D03AF34|nr:uncharacterized protein KY384_001689 [Bacidia gigantensis]KAG8533948.1 hypothetical protein KY384_001689 [Bacidia gigantensis]